ncbi:MAG: serine/threonine-protein kinase, partial [Thermoplasmatota archaeon]
PSLSAADPSAPSAASSGDAGPAQGFEPTAAASSGDAGPAQGFEPTAAIAADTGHWAGRVLDERYRILRLLGEGGMGRVYSAIHPVIGKRAAVKVLHPRFSANEEVVERFVQEARAVNQIGHPNIVDIFETGKLPDGRPYIVMAFIAGQTLADYLRQLGQDSLSPTDRLRAAPGDLRPSPIAEVLRIGRAIAEGLAAAHGVVILHGHVVVFIAEQLLAHLGLQVARVELALLGLHQAHEHAAH